MVVRFSDPQTVEQPQFIRSSAIKCFESSGMPAYVNTRDPDASEYEVSLVTGNADESTPRQPGTRLQASNGPILGDRRLIRTKTAAPSTVSKDVNECKDAAVAGGVFTTTNVSNTPDSTGWQTTWGSTTIVPMMQDFDRCLSSRGYTVGPAAK
jgi:hypothetical protein